MVKRTKLNSKKSFFSGHPTLHPPPHLRNSRLRCCFPPKHKASSKDIIVSSSSPSSLLLSFPSEVSPEDILKNLLVPYTDPIVGSSSSFSSLNSRLRCCSPFYPLSAPHPSWIQISSQNHNAQNVHYITKRWANSYRYESGLRWATWTHQITK